LGTIRRIAPASAALALREIFGADDIVAVAAERVLATAVKRVAVFPAVGATFIVLIGRSGLVDKKVGSEQNVPDPLLCPGNLRRAPWDSRLPSGT